VNNYNEETYGFKLDASRRHMLAKPLLSTLLPLLTWFMYLLLTILQKPCGREARCPT